jgi:flavin reductase (DIM6/NTAB) family NADH-FMN oxidoreductase RutF
VRAGLVYRLFNPQVPAIICSKLGQNIAAMPANSCSSASDSPPMVSIALKRGIRTNRVVRASSKFSINWLSFKDESARNAILNLAKPYASKDNENKLEQWGISYKIMRGIPVIVNSSAYALCEVTERLATGDHDLFIAKVIDAEATADFTGYWRFKDYKPILYLGSTFQNPLTTINLE